MMNMIWLHPRSAVPLCVHLNVLLMLFSLNLCPGQITCVSFETLK